MTKETRRPAYAWACRRRNNYASNGGCAGLLCAAAPQVVRIEKNRRRSSSPRRPEECGLSGLFFTAKENYLEAAGAVAAPGRRGAEARCSATGEGAGMAPAEAPYGAAVIYLLTFLFPFFKKKITFLNNFL